MLGDVEGHFLSVCDDLEFNGEVLQDNDERGTVLFRDYETGREVVLPRAQIAVTTHTKGVIITVPHKLARSRGLVPRGEV